MGDTLSDLYTLLWIFVVYGWVLFDAVRRHLALDAVEVSAEVHWLVAAVLLAGAGSLVLGLRVMGPLLATPAEQAWGVSTPMDRRGWLLPRFTVLLLFGGLAGAAVGTVVAVGFRAAGLGWIAGVGALCGVVLCSWSVAAQGRRVAGRWLRLGGLALACAGVVASAVAIVAHFTGNVLPWVGLPRVSVQATALLVVAGVALVGGVRALPGIHLAALGAGAQLAAATATATIGLDLSLLANVLELQHWRGVGRVVSRPFRARRAGRMGVLLEGELRRQWRRPGVLVVWAALALVQYALVIAIPSLAGMTQLILAYMATNRLARGLRTVAGSPGLRRALGGDDMQVRLVHLVVPSLGALLWWYLTWPASGAMHGYVDAFLLAGVIGACYRAATRPPRTYEGFVMETPFGMLPLDLILQLARGPDLLGATVLVRIFVG